MRNKVRVQQVNQVLNACKPIKLIIRLITVPAVALGVAAFQRQHLNRRTAPITHINRA
jgi:hypothetical protein